MEKGSSLANILENGIPYIKSDNDTAFNILQKICTNKMTIKGYVLCHKKKTPNSDNIKRIAVNLIMLLGLESIGNLFIVKRYLICEND